MTKQENEMVELYRNLGMNSVHINILEILTKDDMDTKKLDMLLGRKDGERSD